MVFKLVFAGRGGWFFIPFCARLHQSGRCGSVVMGGAGGPLWMAAKSSGLAAAGRRAMPKVSCVLKSPWGQEVQKKGKLAALRGQFQSFVAYTGARSLSCQLRARKIHAI